jgi:hypothetical protein
VTEVEDLASQVDGGDGSSLKIGNRTFTGVTGLTQKMEIELLPTSQDLYKNMEIELLPAFEDFHRCE